MRKIIKKNEKGISTRHNPSVSIKDATAGIITFTIDGQTYKAQENMTWGQWCDSEFNTVEAYIEEVNWGDGVYNVITIGGSNYLGLYDENDLYDDDMDYDNAWKFCLDSTKIREGIEFIWIVM